MDKKEFIQKLKNRFSVSNNESNKQKLFDLVDEIGHKEIDYFKLYKLIIETKTFNSLPDHDLLIQYISDCKILNKDKYDFKIRTEQGHWKCIDCSGKGGFMKRFENGYEYFFTCEKCHGEGVAPNQNDNYWKDYVSHIESLKLKEVINESCL